MDMDTLLIECVALAVDVCICGICYKLYKTKSNCLKALKEAPCLEINNELPSNVQENGGDISYAVVTGNIKALGTPLRSQYVSHLRGVIRERITRERKVKWSPFLRIWSSADHDIQHSLNYIPFALCGKNNGLFRKQVCIEIIDPLSSDELILPVIHDEFATHRDTIGEAVFGFFRGERTIGIEEIENMLSENETLTAVGKLVLENNKLKLKQPDEGLTYFLTPLTLDSLVKKINEAARIYKIIAILMGTASFVLLTYIASRSFSELKKRILRARELKRCEEARKLRRMADPTRGSQDTDSGPKCVICLENPVEVFILECGHTCLCLNCSEHVKDFCPVCRERISRLVPAFLP